MTYYSTKSITPGMRKKIPNCFGQFDVCEGCGYSAVGEESNIKGVRFYARYQLVLCDECVDKKDGTWVYEEDVEAPNREEY